MLESQQTNLLSLSLSTLHLRVEKFGANDKLRQQTVGQNGSALPLQTWGEWELSSHGAMVPCFFNELRYMFHGQELNQIIQIQEFDAAKRLKAHHRKLQGHHQTDSHKFQIRHHFGSFPSAEVASRRPGLCRKWLQDLGVETLNPLPSNTYNMISSTILT